MLSSPHDLFRRNAWHAACRRHLFSKEGSVYRSRFQDDGGISSSNVNLGRKALLSSVCQFLGKQPDLTVMRDWTLVSHGKRSGRDISTW